MTSQEVLSILPAICRHLDRDRMLAAGERAAMIAAIERASSLIMATGTDHPHVQELAPRIDEDKLASRLLARLPLREPSAPLIDEDKLASRLIQKLRPLLKDPSPVAKPEKPDARSASQRAIAELAGSYPELYRVLSQVATLRAADLGSVLAYKTGRMEPDIEYVRLMTLGLLIHEYGRELAQPMVAQIGYRSHHMKHFAEWRRRCLRNWDSPWYTQSRLLQGILGFRQLERSGGVFEPGF